MSEKSCVLPGRTNLLALSVVLAFGLFSPGPLCAQTSVIAVDVYNKKIHVEQGGNVKRPVGGLAKIATALVALDWSDVTKVPLTRWRQCRKRTCNSPGPTVWDFIQVTR